MSGNRDLAEVSTLDVVEAGGGPPGGGPLRVPALTVLFHPDAARIGERARLTALTTPTGTVHVSRTATEFAQPGSVAHTPLADPVLSRRGLRIASVGPDLWSLTPGASAVAVDGAPLTGESIIDRAAVVRGIVIELASRVVLVLHFVGPPRDRGPRMGLIGDSDGIEELRGQIRRVADVPVSVLIRGESGSGKELVARALHQASTRASGPCIAVNMATVPASVAASELFGHARGSFTGAVGEHRGYFAQAHGGTLFLDEVGDTPVDVQGMLLRVLETSEIQPLGAAATRTVDVRLIAATDMDLERAAQAHTFRAPLLHRLSGYVISIAPLRERRDDIGRLFIHFLRAELEAVGELARLKPPVPGAPPWISAALIARLARHSWPGNVRQLRNVVQQLVISSRGSDKLQADAPLEKLLASPPIDLPLPSPRIAVPQTRKHRSPAEIEDDELVSCLHKHNWKTGAAAADLGISRTSLYALIEKSKQVRKAADLSAGEILARQAGKITLDELAEELRVSKRGLLLRMRQLGIDTD